MWESKSIHCEFAMDKSKTKPGQGLMEALNFDETDLAANREGRFSQDQYEDLSRRWRTMLIAMAFLVIFSPVMCILTIIVHEHNSASRDFNAYLFAAMAAAFGCLLIASNYKRVKADLDGAEVRIVEGRVSLDVKSNQDLSIRIRNQKFRVKKEVFLAFKNGDPYVIYYTPNTRAILSVEWLRD